MRAWPFLMGASDYCDYRVVVCPDFIERSGRAQIFRSCVDTSLDGDAGDAVRSAQVRDDKIGPCSLFYRVSQVRKEDGSSAYDAAGRPLLRVDGVVVQRNGRDDRLDPKDADRLIQRALPVLDPSFAAFWTAKRKVPTTVSTQLVEPGRDIRGPRRARHVPLPMVFALLSVLAVSAIGNAVLAWRNSELAQSIAAKDVDLSAANDRISDLSKRLREAER